MHKNTAIKTVKMPSPSGAIKRMSAIVAIGRACAFPLLQTVRAAFTAHGFPYSRVLAFFRPRSDLAHERGTTRCVRSPTMLENKAVLLLALSDLGGLLSPAFSWRTFTLSRPLPPGFWLLRRLRPLSCTLACSRPASAGQAVSEFPSSAWTCSRNP
jgi:hypothetical protein